MFYIHKTNFNDWKVPGFDNHSSNGNAHKVIVTFDVEYESNTHIKDKVNGQDRIITQRSWDDIISIQLALNYENINPIKVFIHRDRNDKYFTFYNTVMKQLKLYLNSIKPDGHNSAHAILKQELRNGNKKEHPFTIEMWGFFLGVDASALSGYVKILTEDGHDDKPSNLVAINGNTVFTSRPLNLIVRDDQRHLVSLFDNMKLVFHDMKKLAPAKANLAVLGDMLHLPKLDTEKWDQEAGKPQGFFKTHMSQLWQQWPKRFEEYAMTDTVITALYGSFVLNFMQGLNDEGLSDFKPATLKSSLSAIVGNVVFNKNKLPSAWINDYLIRELIGKVNDSECSADDLYGYMQRMYRKEKKGEHFAMDALELLDLLNVTNVNNLSPAAYKQACKWLSSRLDYDAIRKGYYFPDVDKVKDKEHRKMADDIKRKRELPYAHLFNPATEAFVGGFNLVTRPGVLPAGPVKRSYDLKSSYVTNGILLADIAAGCGTAKTFSKLNADQFKEVVDYASQVNGPYTFGFGCFNIKYPDDYKGFVMTPQNVNDGPRYFRQVDAVVLSYTDAYTAWCCGASVQVLHLEFMAQAKINGKTMEGVSNEGLVQDVFQQRRARYPKGDPREVLNKQVGNSVYGACGQGDKAHHSRDFNQGKSFYLPFSQITNPAKAAIYTAFTRHHIMLLQKAIHSVAPDATFVNNVTDGMLVQSNEPIDIQLITQAMDKLADPRYRDVVKYHFKGVYFEEKDYSYDEVANLKTRMTFSRDGSQDGRLHAMVGIPSNKLSPEDAFKQCLDHGATKLNITKHIITGITDQKNDTKFKLYQESYESDLNLMKGSTSFKHLQRSWDQPSDNFLGYDFACWPTDYAADDKFCTWQTRYYQDVNEFNNLWEFGRDLIKYGPMYTSTYAPYFKATLDDKIAHPSLTPRYFGEFIKVPTDKSKVPPMIGNEVYYNWLNYVAKHHLGVTTAYHKVVDIISQNDWIYWRGQVTDLPKLDSFKRSIKSHQNDVFVINHVLLHRVGLI